MKNFFGGVVLGAALGAAGLYGVQAFVLGPTADCGGVCAQGTRCEAGSCRVLEPEAEPEQEVEVEAEVAGKGKRKRRGKARAGEAGSDDVGPESHGPPVDNDAGIPRFDSNKDQAIGLADGSGRLSDAEVDRELAKLDKQFQACVRAANDRVDELGTGRVKFGFGVAGSGKVTGVNASAPANLVAGGIVPCVRKAVYGHRFPIFNGPEMAVSSSFSVD